MLDSFGIPVTAGVLHAERFGFGDHPVVLLHGFGTSGFLWRHVAPALPLGKVTAWTIDLLGYGASDRPAEAEYGIAAQAACVEQAMTALRIGRATIVGVDIGAAVALRLAATRPGRLHNLVLISPPPLGQARGEDLSELGRLAARHFFDSTRGMLGASAWLGPLLSQGVANLDAMPARLVARYAAPFIGKDGVRHLQALANAIADDDVAELDISAVSARTLVVRGDLDRWCSASNASALATAIAGAELRAIPDAGRLLPEEAPGALAALLAEWIPVARPVVPLQQETPDTER